MRMLVLKRGRFKIPATLLAPVLSTIPNQSATADNSTFSLQAANTGGAVETWSLSGAPAGFAISSTGLITGIKDTVATSTITVTATNATGSSAKSFTLTISDPPPPGSGPTPEIEWLFNGQSGFNTGSLTSTDYELATIVRTPAYTTDTPSGAGYSLNSASGHLATTTSGSFTTQAITVDCYVKFVSTSADGGLVAKWNPNFGGGRSFSLTQIGTNIEWLISRTGFSSSTASDQITTPLPALNTWHRVTAQFESSTLYLYVNQVLVASKVSTVATSISWKAGSPYRVGSREDSIIRDFNGLVDSVRIYGAKVQPWA